MCFKNNLFQTILSPIGQNTQEKKLLHGWKHQLHWKIYTAPFLTDFTSLNPHMLSSWFRQFIGIRNSMFVLQEELMTGLTPPKSNVAGWKITISSRRYIFKWLVFQCHVSFQGCIMAYVIWGSCSSHHPSRERPGYN